MERRRTSPGWALKRLSKGRRWGPEGRRYRPFNPGRCGCRAGFDRSGAEHDQPRQRQPPCRSEPAGGDGQQPVVELGQPGFVTVADRRCRFLGGNDQAGQVSGAKPGSTSDAGAGQPVAAAGTAAAAATTRWEGRRKGGRPLAGAALPDSWGSPCLPSRRLACIAALPDGSVAEWSKAHAWKVCRG